MKQRQRKTHDYLLRLVVGLLVSLWEVLGRLPLPLTWEIVTADVSLGGNEGAWGSGRSGGWEIKNARCRKIENARCRKHGGLVNGGARRWYMNGGFTDLESISDDPPLAQQPGTVAPRYNECQVSEHFYS